MGLFNGPVIAHGLYVCHHKSRYNVDCSAIHRDKICPLKETYIYMCQSTPNSLCGNSNCAKKINANAQIFPSRTWWSVVFFYSSLITDTDIWRFNIWADIFLSFKHMKQTTDALKCFKCNYLCTHLWSARLCSDQLVVLWHSKQCVSNREAADCKLCNANIYNIVEGCFSCLLFTFLITIYWLFEKQIPIDCKSLISLDTIL